MKQHGGELVGSPLEFRLAFRLSFFDGAFTRRLLCDSLIVPEISYRGLGRLHCTVNVTFSLTDEPTNKVTNSDG